MRAPHEAPEKASHRSVVDMITGQRKRVVNLSNLIFVISLIQFVWLVWYFYTGYGGPQELVARVMSIALILQILFMYQQGYFYPRLPARANDAIIALYLGVCLYAFVYFLSEYEDIAIWRLRENFVSWRSRSARGYPPIR